MITFNTIFFYKNIEAQNVPKNKNTLEQAEAQITWLEIRTKQVHFIHHFVMEKSSKQEHNVFQNILSKLKCGKVQIKAQIEQKNKSIEVEQNLSNSYKKSKLVTWFLFSIWLSDLIVDQYNLHINPKENYVFSKNYDFNQMPSELNVFSNPVYSSNSVLAIVLIYKFVLEFDGIYNR